MSFPVKNVLKKEINGSFKLQPQSCLTNPLQPIAMGENSQSSVEEVISIDDGFTIGTGHATSAATTTANQQPFDAVTNPSTQFPSNAADDDGDGGGGISGSSTIAFSKKAIHQRDADENLFLRFLELDPPLEIAPAVTTAAGAAAVPGGPTNTTAPIAGTSGVCSGNRRQSSLKHNTGRTPFTITKRLTRTADRGFGFSIVWTHPPRIEKVESGLSADKCGIVPGDYVIFVDKHNVVTMPEMDILNLIRSQGTGLMLEIFRRPTGRPNGIKSARIASQTSVEESVMAAPITRNQSIPIVPNTPAMVMPPLSSTACSNTSISVETTSRSRRLHLPQVTFSKESILLPTLVDDQRRKVIYQLINREQNFVTAMQYGMERFVIPLKERKDLISPNDNRTLFQNIDELVQIAEDILEQLVQDDNEPHLNFLSRVYLSKTTAICAAYKKYCNGIKRADCVLVNKSRNTNSDFMNFIIEPPIPRKRPDLTTFIHRPLQHFREILKLIQITSSHCRADSEEYKNFTSVINDLQAAYREITVGGGLMEPLGEGRPLLTLQDLESRLVFTRCKPFILASPGRQWIFGGDLSRVEGRSVKPYWTLLFSDILLFAKVSRDRVLFITEDPVPLVNITDSFFNIRKKVTEFRLIIDPNGRQAESPTVHCAPDITRTPRRNSRKRSIILRAPSPELKAVWQNLLQRQIFLVNAALGTTPLNSPLESPDVIHTFVPFSDIGAATTSMASIKLSSVDSLPLQKNYHPAATTTSHHQPSPKQQKKVSKQLEELIDEKCRMLNKAGTSKGGALHLAQWMKGQLDKEAITNPIIETEQDDENLLDEWSPEMLKKRSRELQLVDANGVCQSLKSELSKRGMVEEILLSEVDEESKSPSRSTTSDSQITVRSSPNAKHNVDKVSVCLKCQKNCKNKSSHTLSSTSIKSSLHIQSQQSSTSTSQGATSNRCCHSSSASSQRSLVNSRASTLTEAFDYKLIGETGGAGGQESQTQTTTDSSKDEVRYSDKSITKANCIEKHKVTSIENRIKCHTPCKCKCSPSEFNQDIGSPEETRQETCKIIENAYRIEKVDKTPNHVAKPNRHQHEQSSASDHSDCKCVCTMSTTTDGDSSNIMKHDEDDDWSLMLIGLAQINPTTSLVHMDPFEAVPTISVVPPTPESLTSRYNSIFSNQKSKSEEDDISPEDSPQDEEPPYKALHTPLRRYGTVSSLEKVPSDDTDEKTYNSSDDDDDEIDDELKITTKEIYSNTQSLRNWTARAGSYVAEKMSFFEESKAFFDKYLGRRETSLDQNDDETVEECTSGATSGEDVWGTPTSGGENEEMHMFNSDHTHSSPTKSSSSMTGDDDTELMMDELLMAPPMTASSIRGLLPRRRLEPLFEEDTESGEDSDEEEDVEDDDDDDDDDNIDGGNLYKGHPYADVVQINGHASRDSGEISGSGKSSPVTTPVERIAMEMTKKTTTPVDISEAMKIGVINYGSGADTSFSAGHPTVRKDVRDYVANTDTTASAIINHHQQSPVAFVAGLSPRLEMRLALNRDIMGDEDLINYDPGPDLTTLLGGDLSTYHRMTGKDLLNRSAAAMVAATSKAPQLRQAQTIFLQQKNSKMDTPTLNRKKSNLNTWNSSASVDQVDENGLTDLERLARREKMFSMSQLRSGRVAPQQPDPRARKISGSPDKLTLDLQTRNNKKNKFFNFLSSRRNSENHIIKSGFSQQDMSNDNEMATLIGGGDKDISLRKDVDKTLDRRFWKQLSKRRRSSSVSEVSSTS